MSRPPEVYRLCCCGPMHAKVPCEESEARHAEREAIRVRLEAARKSRKSIGRGVGGKDRFLKCSDPRLEAVNVACHIG